MNSGKFYVIKFSDGSFHKGINGTGRPIRCNDFEDAAKLFGCSLTGKHEVYSLAERLNGSVLEYDYALVGKRDTVYAVNFMNLV